MSSELSTKRTCGDCVVCCVYPRIKAPQLKKPPMQNCPYLKVSKTIDRIYFTGKDHEDNCMVKDTDYRPECCEYVCCWREGFGDEEDRPDKSLMLFDRTHKIENAIEAKPLKANHEQTEESRRLIIKMGRLTQKLVIVTSFCERRIRRIVGKPVEIV